MQRILIPLFFVLALYSKAQIQSQLYVDGKVFDELQISDSMKLVEHVNKLQVAWVKNGFFFSGVDSVKQVPNAVSVFLHKGEKWKAELKNFKGSQLTSYLTRQLKSYVNGGYPFASIKLDSGILENSILKSSLVIDPGPSINYDSAYFFTVLKTNESYVYQLLDIEPGNPFSERDYRTIEQKIERSSFLTIQRPTDLSFKNNKAKTYLDIKEHASSTFQGVIGLQQIQNGKTTAVGALELDVQNLFRSGKQFKFAWERFAEESQSLNIFYKHPFFLNSKLSPSFSFGILKQDTTFLTRRTSVGLNTYVAPKIELSFEFETTNGTLISSDVSVIANTGLADFKRKTYNVQLSKGHFSSLGKLKNDIIWRFSSSGGTKKIQENISLPDSYYDSIRLETNFYRFEADIAYQIKILKRQSFFHHIRAGTLQSEELLSNELYRLGGLNSLRGFNEKQFFGKSYVLSRVEFRSFFENRSYAYVFYDHLFFSRELRTDQPYGVGLGFALATSTGQFSFALAVGNSADQNISFSAMKAHFGYISRF
ncbi:MAG: hypothetical protein ABJG47_07495 [Ekhidna sp.]